MAKSPQRYVRPFAGQSAIQLWLFCAFIGMDGDFSLTRAEQDRLWKRAGHMPYDGLWAEIESILHDRRVSA